MSRGSPTTTSPPGRRSSCPKGAPKAIVDKLNEVTHATMDTPAIKTRMLEIGVTGIAPERRSPEYLAKFVVDEVARWEGPIKSGGLQVD